MPVIAKEVKNQPVTPKKKKDKVQEPSFKDSIITYLKGVKSEWGKVSWPERQQIVHETLIVILITIFVTVLIFFIDVIFKFIIGLIPV